MTIDYVNPSVQLPWALKLSLQMQSVLFLALRGPDGLVKSHPCKLLQSYYRGTVLLAARYGRELNPAKGSALNWESVIEGDTFMKGFPDISDWAFATRFWFESIDELPLHYALHFIHGAEIIGFKHPSPAQRERWKGFYWKACDNFHMNAETEDQLDRRLNDWGQREWGT